MANNFLITISAIDRVTATVAKINASMNRITAPIRNIQKSAAALSREMGFEKFGKSLTNVARTAADLGGKLTSLAAPLAVVVGGGTLAGVAALATEWARLGSEISRSAATLGMASGELQGLRGAARAAGLSSEELTGGLKSLGDTMQDAIAGRNQEALVIMQRLRVELHRTADGSVDTARGFRDLSRAIVGAAAAGAGAEVQGKIARTFGLEALLPLLRQGPAAIDAYERKVKEIGGVMSGPALAAAQSFGLSLNYLHIATDGLRNSIGSKLIPVLQPLIDQLTNWISANRELIALKVEKFVSGIVEWIGKLDFNKIADDVKSFGKSVEYVVDKLGGWKNAAIGIAIALNGNLIASVLNLGGALLGLGGSAIPIVIRGFGLLAAGIESSVLPAILKGTRALAFSTAVMADSAAGVPVLGSALGGLSAVFASVSAAIMATPFGWIVAGIAAVAAAGSLIFKYWRPLRAFFSGFGEGVAQAFEPIMPIFRTLGGWVKAAVGWFGELLTPIDDAAETTKSFGEAGQEAGKIFAAAFSPVTAILKWISDAMQRVTKWLPKSWHVGVDDVPTPAPGTSGAVARVAAAGKAPGATSGQQTVGARNNNPGNLRTWGDTPRDTRGYAVFPTPDAGLAATIKNLQAQQDKHGLNTIRQIISKWAPAGENNTAAYIDDIVKKTGFGADQKLDLHDQDTVTPLVKGIIKHEGNGAMFTDDQVAAAVAAQSSGPQYGAPQPAAGQKVEISLSLNGVPKGMTVSARTKDGGMPVRVSYSMPTDTSS